MSKSVWFKVRYLITARIRHLILASRVWVYRSVWGMDIGQGVLISMKANLDLTTPKQVHIGNGTYIAFGATVLTHDLSRELRADTYIGTNCFIGAHSIIMPGAKVGNSVIVGAGAVVTGQVPDNVIVAGNPAKIIRRDIQTKAMGIMVNR